MSDRQWQQVQVAQAETNTTSEPAKWGELPTPERIAELEARMAKWKQIPAEARGDPATLQELSLLGFDDLEGPAPLDLDELEMAIRFGIYDGPLDLEDGFIGDRSAFDCRGRHAWHGLLSGADVFYLAARTLANAAGPDAIAAAVARLRTRDLFEPLGFDFSSLHLEGAILGDASLEGALLRNAHLEYADLSAAGLERAYLDGAHLEHTNLSGAHLEGADLDNAHLEGAVLNDAHLERASIRHAHLMGASLRWASLARATLDDADLESAALISAHLEDASFSRAHLEHADLTDAHLEGSKLSGTQLEDADLRLAYLDRNTHLNNAILTGVSLDQIRLDNTNLTVVKWGGVAPLGDELRARAAKDNEGHPKSRTTRIEEYEAAVRANRVLAVALRAQGLADDADIFAYRAQILQRQLSFRQRQFGRWLFSALLAMLSGYGYRLGNIFRAYTLVVFTFALGYLVPPFFAHGGFPSGQDALNALQISLNAIHGRVFFAQFTLDTAQSWLATAESVFGIVIEGVFVAMLIQRLFHYWMRDFPSEISLVREEELRG